MARRLKRATMLSGLVACMGGAALADGASAEGYVYVGENKPLIWRTATISPAQLALEWPANAVRAELQVTSGVSSQVATYPITDTSLCHYAYSFELPTNANDERVENLIISYYDADDTLLESATAKLGIVLGTANGATVPCLVKGTEDFRWSQCTVKSVIPIPESSENLRLDGSVVEATPDAPGWWQTLLPCGSHALALAIGGADVVRTINVRDVGLIFIVR